VSRRVAANGVVCVSWQQVCIGAHDAGLCCDVHVDGKLLRFDVDDVLVKTAARRSTGEVRNKQAGTSHQRRALTIDDERQRSTEAPLI
jgi:hypothetical protein